MIDFYYYQMVATLVNTDENLTNEKMSNEFKKNECMGINITGATKKDLPDILLLLKEVDLPSEGVDHHIKYFLVLKVQGKLLGCVGVEIFKKSCLLRSLAITTVEQGKGYGQILVKTVLKVIRRKKIKKVYLLTIDGADYFRRFNFRVIKRNEVASEIQKTLAFNLQCCRTAICMFRSIN